MFVIEIIAAALLVILTLTVGYLYFLAAVAAVGRKTYTPLSRECRFLVLVPAHNEENVIIPTIDSLRQVRPTGPVRIVVIADNCTDQTAALAAGQGVEVLARDNPVERGKGYALEWAIAQYDLERFDAVAVVDADTRVQPDMLEAMAGSLQAGYGAVQLYYGFTGEKDTPLAHLQHMASVVENLLFYKPRAILNLPILLRGTGMAISAEVLNKYPWDSHSITEDVDYAVKLLENGIRIDFSHRSAVLSAATSSYDQSRDQKMRWASGTFLLIRQKALSLLKTALLRRRWKLAELAFSFLLLSRPALIYLAVIAILLSLLAPAGERLFYVLWGTALAALLVVYLLLGIAFVPSKSATIKALVHIPKYAIWYFLVQLKAVFKHKKMGWVRTDRK